VISYRLSSYNYMAKKAIVKISLCRDKWHSSRIVYQDEGNILIEVEHSPCVDAATLFTSVEVAASSPVDLDQEHSEILPMKYLCVGKRGGLRLR